MYVPERGDLVWLDFTPQTGRETLGKRPAIVLSPAEYNAKVGLCVACPVTSKVKGYPFEVRLPDKLPIEGVILADQIRTVDWRERRIRFITKAPDRVIHETVSKFSTLIL